ncbi:DUF1330 domain-containing protein, partial [Streptomyces sp. NPDC049577]|uniref:DUF1330 domain-containing protein n=1 Tax=Streptomyces sp. NPDC049577 TaxID=3155153 RepID=UPI003445EB24
MPAYALANFRASRPTPDVIEYVERIQATLDPYDGHFIVHGGGNIEVLEGAWDGPVVIIAFPGVEQARAWYASPAYQAILPLRTDHVEGDVILIEGVGRRAGPSGGRPGTAACRRGAAPAGRATRPRCR